MPVLSNEKRPVWRALESIYLTYAEPGDYGGGLAMARAKLRTN